MEIWTLVEGKLADGLPMRLHLCEDKGAICAASLSDEFVSRFGFLNMAGSSEVLREAATQVREYFAGSRMSFDMPISMNGTEFQRRVWEGLRRIPFGGTMTYGDLAESISAPGAFRAVGNANGRNPLPLLVPCHRVLASGGKIGGFTSGVGLKRRLLDHESTILGRPCVRSLFQA
jgi:methylated-DNA-[protein]-cysteine S-methyltransferase